MQRDGLAGTAGETGERHDLLVFEFQGEAFAVEASHVDAVISWRDPVPVPRGGTDVRGVIQDRGRVVAVLRHPSLGPGTGDGSRIVVCATKKGHIGLPAESTRTVGPVFLHGEAGAGLVDSSEGPITIVAPEEIVASLLERAGRLPAATLLDV